MAYQRWWKTIRDQQGNAVNGASCAVYNGGTGTLATIYDPNTDDSAPGGLSNPFTTTANGVFGFMAADGEYDVQISGGNGATQQYRVMLNGFVSGSAAELSVDLAAPTGAGLIGYDKSLSYPAGTVGAQFNAQYTTGYVIDHAGSPSMAIVPTGFAQSMGIQSAANNTASRLYIVPKGTPASGATGTLKIFATDYIADPTNYRDMGLYYDSDTSEFLINSKYNGTPGTPAPVYFSFQDGAQIAGGFYRDGTTAGMVLGGRFPSVTFFSGVPVIFAASAAFVNNTLLRWYKADGTSANGGIRYNSATTPEFECLINGVMKLTVTTSYTRVVGALITDYLLGTAGQATPSVAATSFLQVPTNGSPYNITNFSGGTGGQRLTVLFSDGNATLVNSGSLRLQGGTNFTPTANTIVNFILTPSLAWIETGRSVN